MGCEGMNHHAALWEIPILTVWKMQKAYLERKGVAQHWVKSRLDRLTEKYDELYEQQEKRLQALEDER